MHGHPGTRAREDSGSRVVQLARGAGAASGGRHQDGPGVALVQANPGAGGEVLDNLAHLPHAGGPRDAEPGGARRAGLRDALIGEVSGCSLRAMPS